MKFIKRCWDEIGPEFTTAVMGFFNSFRLPTDSNIAWVALAPKFVGAKEIKDLRPISMVGVKWSFVDLVLQKMGFGHKWRAWVMECVATASMSVLINGSPSKPFKIERGLCINFDKSSLIPINCEEQWIQRMCNLLGCKGDTLPVKYLGISLGANPRLVKTWKPILDKVEEKLSLWEAKVLNKAGKLVLIKSVLNSLPVFYLSLFKMPKAVAEKLISLQRRFMWSKKDDRNGMALVRWEMEECPLWKKIVCSCNNLNSNELLSTQALPTRGGPWKDICQLHIMHERIRDKMVTSLSMEIGDGRRTQFWEDVWLLYGSLKDRFPRLFSVSNQCGSVMQVEALPEVVTSYSFTRTIWKGLVPPRVELFAWMCIYVVGVECLDIRIWLSMVLSGFDEKALSQLDRGIEE
ncbi:uncharacterized protein [Arachis hypogaea]|uniref:uncharacterized protein n=1 Tax=Arachis hypogaea TaxID=3818 RepID=UPI003B2154D4